MSMFAPATREKLKARIALDGPTGSGKTYSGLEFAFALAGEGGRVCVIDTEHRSASKYAGYSPHGIPWNFDVCDLKHYAPSAYTAAIKEAGQLGYDVILIDSLSHAWEGVGGALDQVDKKAAASGNSFTAWKDVTPQHRDMIEAILASHCHVISTMRTKMDYVMEETTNRTGKKVMQPKKVGMAPIQRQGMEYEFDIVCDFDIHHMMTVSKTRCPEIDGQVISKPGPEFLTPVIKWLNEGTTPAPQFVTATNQQPEQTEVAPANQANGNGTLDSNSGQQSKSAYVDGEPLDIGQRETIIALASRIGEAMNIGHEGSVSWLKDQLNKKNIAKLSDLTYGQATRFIPYLEATLTREEAKQLMSDMAEDQQAAAGQ